MIRLAAAGAGVMLLCAAAYVMGRQPGLPFGTEAVLMALVSAPALFFSLVAAAAAFRAAAVASKLKRDTVLLARSIDRALAEIVARSDRDAATMSEIASSAARDIAQLSERIGERRTDVPPAADNDLTGSPRFGGPKRPQPDEAEPGRGLPARIWSVSAATDG